MFRRLFAIETEALQAHVDEHGARHDQLDMAGGDSLREIARFAATPSRYGMWSSRAAN